MSRHSLSRFLRPYLRINLLLLLCMVLLLCVGIAFINSACATREGHLRWLHLQQLTQWVPVGLVIHLAIARMPYRRLVDWSVLPYVMTLCLLVLVLIPGIGTQTSGARRWLFGFQPSEFAKFALLPAIAFILAGCTLERGGSRLTATLVAAVIPTVLIALQPDLGTAIVIVPATAAMLFVSGCAPRALFAMALSGILAATVFLGLILGPEMLPLSDGTRERIERVSDRVIYPHWKKRVITFAFPDRDPLGAGWNKRQSEIAVGSGGRTGKGYLNGTQNILGFLPQSVSSTDFIFSVIAEATGFLGSVVLLVLYAGLFGAIAYAGIRCRDSCGRLLCAGVGTLLFVHVFVNIAMTVGRMPITGLPLPLVSYGGSFTISTMAMLGLVQSVAIHGRHTEHSH